MTTYLNVHKVDKAVKDSTVDFMGADHFGEVDLADLLECLAELIAETNDNDLKGLEI